MNDAAAGLREAAGKNRLNIGTADHLMSQAGAEVLPGQLINWAVRLDPDALEECIEQFNELRSEYQEVSNELEFERVDWGGHDGSAGETFKYRWNEMRKHATESEESLDRIVEAQVQVMRDLQDKFVNLQQALTGAIDEHLSSVRTQYVKALCAKGSDAVVESAISNANIGANFGAIGGAKGIAAGTAGGAVFGLIEGFMGVAEDRTRALAALETSAQDLLSQLPGTEALTLPNTGDDNKVSLNYREFDPKHPSWVDSWDEGFDQPWVGE